VDVDGYAVGEVNVKFDAADEDKGGKVDDCGGGKVDEVNVIVELYNVDDTGIVDDEKLVDKDDDEGDDGDKGEGAEAYESDTGLWDSVADDKLNSAG
jgi:hypothetical protein